MQRDPPANPRDGKLDVRTASGRRREVFVSTQRVGGYAFWTKHRLQPASHRTVIVVLLEATMSPRLYVIPSHEWDTAVPPLTDRDYEGNASEPEFGVELNAASLGALARYAWSDRMVNEHFG